MHNYSARPWMSIGIFMVLLSIFFYLRTPITNGPIDIIPVWMIVIAFAFSSFFIGAFLVDNWMIFSSKFVLHEIYLNPRSESLSKKTFSKSIRPTETTYGNHPEELDFTLDDGQGSISSSTTSTSSSSSSTSSSLRPRSDINKYVMF